VFQDLRERLVPIVKQYGDYSAPDDAFLRNHFPADAQWAFGLDVIKQFGYDLKTGRQDYSTHPFSTTFSISDVRITTRIDEHFFNPGFFGTLHESGHAMYEQGVDASLERTLLADGTSLGMHESQSRLWENLVGRSLPFWNHYYPKAQASFPEALSGVSQNDFYRAINRVSPSLIRVEADEVTYNLHIMVRFELEVGLLEGSISVDELPAAWNDRMEEYLGVRPETDSDGVLQDIHWSLGALGYFPTYALGNLISTQFFNQAASEIDDLDGKIESGSFDDLLDWLRKNVHVHGRRKSATKILEEATGSGLSVDSWIQYVEKKYEKVYGR
jgi:carboxypeptidase Taq